MAVKWTPPNIENATPSFLCDELGRAADEENLAKKKRGFFKTALAARLDGQTEAKGEEYQLIIETSTRESLDAVGIREALLREGVKIHIGIEELSGLQFLQRYWRTTPVETYRATKLVKENGNKQEKET